MTRLEAERRGRGWSQVELAYHARLTPSKISGFERRRLRPSATYALRLGQVLGVSPDALLDEVPPRPVAAEVQFG